MKLLLFVILLAFQQNALAIQENNLTKEEEIQKANLISERNILFKKLDGCFEKKTCNFTEMKQMKSKYQGLLEQIDSIVYNKSEVLKRDNAVKELKLKKHTDLSSQTLDTIKNNLEIETKVCELKKYDQECNSNMMWWKQYHQNAILANKQINQKDGSHKTLVKYVKSTLNKPSSFIHISTEQSLNYDNVLVKMTYSFLNKSGTRKKKLIWAKHAPNGKIDKSEILTFDR